MENNQKFESLVGTVLDDRYKIEKFLGTGGMSIVYKARDLRANRKVAIKMLRDEIADDANATNRFINESKAVSMLSHPNIVGIYDVSFETQKKYLVMEYIDGISLCDYMNKRGKLELDEIITFCEQILAAIEHAHSKGVIHRDIKPQNIMILKDGIVKVTDFGIAKVIDSKTVTISDKAIGTVYYISPEQAAGKRADSRSDLYSLGVMMYEMSTGTLPFDDENPISVLMMQIHDKPVPPRQINKAIPRGLEQLILCSMEKDPRRRYRTAKDMFSQLRRIKRKPNATILTPAQLASARRSEKNRRENKSSRSATPIILGIAFAIFFVALISLFYALDALNISVVGSNSISVPNAVGLQYTAADELGFNEDDYIVTVEYEYSATVAKGTVISQDPIGSSKRKSPCAVTLIVSNGPETTILSDYSMMDWRVAQTELRSKGFVVTVSYLESNAISSGHVINTSPMPGETVEQGSEILLFVSTGTTQSLITIPEFIGSTEAQAKAMMDEIGLLLGTVTYTRSTKPAGTIIGCSGEPGKNVLANTTALDFTVSGGKDFALNYCPDVLSMNADEAHALLREYGIDVTLSYITSNEPVGTVLTQTPSAAQAVENNVSSITLLASGGSDYSNNVTLFKLVGENLKSAKTLLDFCTQGKCLYELEIKYVTSSTPVDTVLEQYPAAGVITLTNGILKVKLTLSGGPDYIPPTVTVTVPNLVGITWQEAINTLNAVGIEVGEITYVASEELDGYVISQSVASQEVLTGPEGSFVVDITVSGGPDHTVTPDPEPPTPGDDTTVSGGDETTSPTDQETTLPEPEINPESTVS